MSNTTRLFSRARAFRADRKGATAVEFAMILPPFLFLLTALFQIGFVFTAGQVLEDATTEFARLVRTGQAQGQSMTQDQFRTEFCKRIAVFMRCDDGNLLIDVQVLPSFGAVQLSWPLEEDGDFDGQGQFTPGQSGETVLIRTFYQFPVWLPFVGSVMSDLPNGNRLLAASAAFRNEPFGTTGAGT